MAKKVMYVAGVGFTRAVGLPVCGLRDFIGHKVMLLEDRDAIEILNGTDFIECDKNVKVDLDYTLPAVEETSVVLENFKTQLDEAALSELARKTEEKEERKNSRHRSKNEEETV